MITATQLVAEVTAVGATEAETQLLAVGAAADAGTAYLASLGEQAFTTGAGFDGLSVSSDSAAISLASTATAATDADAVLTSLAASADTTTASFAAAKDELGLTDAALADTSVQADTAAVSLDKTSASADGAAFSMDGLGGVAKKTAIALGITALALGVVAAVSVKMAGDFKESMTQLVTGAGESQANLQMVSDGILAMAPKVGETTGQLAAGMYLIESAGQHGAQALVTLQAAAEGARVGAASLADVANGVTTIMTDYASAHVTAAQATNTLIAAVSEGKTHLADLSNAMATVLPTAAAVGVAVNDAAAAVATMTAEGTPAAAAATYLKQMLMALEAPASKGAKTIAELGLTTAQVSDEMKVSLPGTLQMITDALKEKFPEGSAAYVEALKNIAGGSRQMQGMLELTGTHLDVFKNNVLGITDAVNKGGDSITGWNLAQDDFNTKMAQAGAALQVVAIKIGTAMLPALSGLLNNVTPAIQAFGDWITNSGVLSTAMDRLSGWLGQVGQAFHDVFDPVKQVVDIWPKLQSEVTGLGMTGLPPLSDALDRVNNVLHWIGDASDHLKDPLHFVSHAFDQVTDAVNRTTTPLMGMAPDMKTLQDAWDRANKPIKDMSDALDRTTGAWAKTGNAAGTATTPLQGFMQGLKKIWDTLLAVDWGAIGQHFTDIGAAISKVDWGKVGTAIVNMAQSFIKVDWGKVGTNLGVIFTTLSKVDWGTVATGVANVAKAIGSVDWGGMLLGINSVIIGIGNFLAFIYHLFDGVWYGLGNVVKAFQWLYDTLVGHSIIPDLITSIVTWFASLPKKALDAVQGLLSGAGSLVSFFAGLATQAWTWGSNIMQQVASGIAGNISNFLGNAMGQVGNFITSHLPHSPAERGPLRDLPLMGAAITKQISEGMLSNLPMLQSSLHLMLSPIASPGAFTGAFPTTGSNSPVQIIVQPPPIYLDGRLLAQGLMPYVANQIRYRTGVQGI